MYQKSRGSVRGITPAGGVKHTRGRKSGPIALNNWITVLDTAKDSVTHYKETTRKESDGRMFIDLGPSGIQISGSPD